MSGRVAFPAETFKFLGIIRNSDGSLTRVIRIWGVNDGAEYVVKSVGDETATQFKETDATIKDLSHPFVSTPKECYQLSDSSFMLRPYSEGIPLRIRAKEFQDDASSLKTRTLAAQLVSGIEYLHSKDLLCV